MDKIIQLLIEIAPWVLDTFAPHLSPSAILIHCLLSQSIMLGVLALRIAATIDFEKFNSHQMRALLLLTAATDAPMFIHMSCYLELSSSHQH